MDKIGRYVSDVGRRDVRLAFPSICDLGFLFQATRGKPADCRGDSHIGLFCPERQKSGKNASSRFSRAGEPRSGREPPRIRRISSSRRAETEKECHLLRELVPRRSVLPQEPREAKPAARGNPQLNKNTQAGSPLPAIVAHPKNYPASPSHAAIFGAYPKTKMTRISTGIP